MKLFIILVIINGVSILWQGVEPTLKKAEQRIEYEEPAMRKECYFNSCEYKVYELDFTNHQMKEIKEPNEPNRKN